MPCKSFGYAKCVSNGLRRVCLHSPRSKCPGTRKRIEVRSPSNSWGKALGCEAEYSSHSCVASKLSPTNVSTQRTGRSVVKSCTDRSSSEGIARSECNRKTSSRTHCTGADGWTFSFPLTDAHDGIISLTRIRTAPRGERVLRGARSSPQTRAGLWVRGSMPKGPSPWCHLGVLPFPEVSGAPCSPRRAWVFSVPHSNAPSCVQNLACASFETVITFE